MPGLGALHEAVDLLRIIRRVGKGDISSQRMPQESDALDSQVAQESPDVPAVLVDGIAGRRLVGKPSSPQIHGPNPMRGRQGGSNSIPAPAICGQAVNTENIAPLPFP